MAENKDVEELRRRKDRGEQLTPEEEAKLEQGSGSKSQGTTGQEQNFGK